MAQDFNKTINLPSTKFEMRAGLPKKEPKLLQDWQENHLYEELMRHNEGKPRYVLHDGPPYANGNIHMGTALNKIIKDIIVRYKNMTGSFLGRPARISNRVLGRFRVLSYCDLFLANGLHSPLYFLMGSPYSLNLTP